MRDREIIYSKHQTSILVYLLHGYGIHYIYCTLRGCLCMGPTVVSSWSTKIAINTEKHALVVPMLKLRTCTQSTVLKNSCVMHAVWPSYNYVLYFQILLGNCFDIHWKKSLPVSKQFCSFTSLAWNFYMLQSIISTTLRNAHILQNHG